MVNWLKTYICKNYYIHKILPFYFMALIIELSQKIYFLIRYPDLFDWRLMELCKSFGIAALETTIGFLYIALILLTFFMTTPVHKQNHTSDKRLTKTLFYIFTLINLLEDIAESIRFDLTQTTFVRQTIQALISNPNVYFFEIHTLIIICLISFVTWIYLHLWQNNLFPDIRIPVIQYRLRYICLLFIISGVITLNYNKETIADLSNPYNNELAKDGMLTIIQMLKD